MIGGRDDGSAATHRDPWRRLEARGGLEELAFPSRLMGQLAELPQRYRAHVNGPPDRDREQGQRTALMLLFEGPRGSGKTCTAQALGAELALPVIEADTEALLGAGSPVTIARLLAQTAPRPAVLVLDRADDLLAAEENDDPAPRSALLTLDRLRTVVWGVVIVCAARQRGVPRANLERFDVRLAFPVPDTEARAAIWRRCLPPESAVAPDDIAFLAGAFRLSGAEISACARAAMASAGSEGRTLSLVDVSGGLQETYRGRLISDATRVAMRELRERSARSAPSLDIGIPRQAGQAAVPGRAAPPGPARALSRAAMGSRLGAIALAVLGLIGAVALGLAVPGPRSHPPARLDGSATAGPIRVSYPTSWTARAGSAPGLSSVLVLSSRSGRLEVGWFAGAADGIPAQFIPASAPAAQAVSLGTQSFDRILALRTGEALYARPGAGGTAVAICETASRAFASDCERILATLRVALAPGPQASAVQVATVLVTLNRARARLGAELSAARDAAQQAQVATELAAAHATAAAAVAALPAANAPLVTALRTLSGAYAALARAAGRQNPGAYQAASRSVQSAEAALRRVLARPGSLA